MNGYEDCTVEVYEDGARILGTTADGRRVVVGVLKGAATVVMPGLLLANMHCAYWVDGRTPPPGWPVDSHFVQKFAGARPLPVEER